MGIQEALREARGHGIRRSYWSTDAALVVEDSKLPLRTWKKKNARGGCWNPTPDDILADDWEVITEGTY